MYHRFSFGGMAGYVYTLIGFLALVVGADAKTSVTPATKEVGRGGVSYQVTVSSDTDWKAATAESWVTVSADHRLGEGNAIVTVAPNPTPVTRRAAITIGDQTHMVIQHAAAWIATDEAARGAVPVPLRTDLLTVPNTSAGSVALALGAGIGKYVAEAAIASYGNTFHIDTRFAAQFESNGAEIWAVTATSDGGFLAGGSFSTIGGQMHLGLAKYKADGTVDAAFNQNGGFNGLVESIAIQTDGRILVAGDFTSFNGTARAGLARLKADGALDTSFNPSSELGSPVRRLAVQADGRILVSNRSTDVRVWTGAAVSVASAGTVAVGVTTTGYLLDKGIARLNADGTADASFSPGSRLVNCLAVQPDGKIVVGGYFTAVNGTSWVNIARLNTDGTPDTTFIPGAGFDSVVECLAVQTDGKIIVGGHFTTFNGVACKSVARLKSDGSLDTSFTPSPALNFTVETLVLQADGRIVVGGVSSSSGGQSMRLNTDGSQDTSFTSGSTLSLNALALLSDGKIVEGGYYATSSGTPGAGLARLSTNGALDTLTTDNTRSPSAWLTAVPLAGGKILVGGSFDWVNGVAGHGIVRLNADGTSDSTSKLGAGVNGWVGCLAPQSDGKIIVGGTFTTFNGVVRNSIARIAADGSLDANFDPGTGFGGTIYSLAVQADGRIVVGGTYNYIGSARTNIVRLNSGGTLDATFNPSYYDLGANAIYALAIQSDGRILLGGSLYSYNYTNNTQINNIVRLNADGSIDTTFIPGSGPVTDVNAFALQTDGKILVGGYFPSFDGRTRNGIARLNTNGSLDSSFDPGTATTAGVTSLALQNDGRVVVADISIKRLNTDGSLDGGFTAPDYNGFSGTVSFTDDGRLLVSGGMALGGGVKQIGLVLLTSDTASSSSSSSSSGGASSSSSSGSSSSGGPSSSSSGGGGGGGAPGVWYLAALTVAALARFAHRR